MMEKESKAATPVIGTGADDVAEEAKWGTKQMGPPAAPSVHPENQRAALWNPRGDDEHPPYVLEREPVSRPFGGGGGGSPMETILDFFNSWTKKAEDLAQNIWNNLKIAPSKTEAAMGKLSLTTKSFMEGGFESLYKQTFSTEASEKLKKTFACYLSTATGPVAGTLYLSSLTVAFCSDRPLTFMAPSGQESWSYYKMKIPLAKIDAVSPVALDVNPQQKYIKIVTVDGHDFWFMGFVHYDKAVDHLLNAVFDFRATGTEAPASKS